MERRHKIAIFGDKNALVLRGESGKIFIRCLVAQGKIESMKRIVTSSGQIVGESSGKLGINKELHPTTGSIR